MYYPIFRGRQFELLALRDCITNKLINTKIIPIIEPVKFSSTLIKTLEVYTNNNHPIGLVLNPCVGSWNKDIKDNKDNKLFLDFKSLINNNEILRCYYVTESISTILTNLKNKNINCNDVIFIFNNVLYIDDFFATIEENKGKCHILPDKGEFRRKIRKKRVLFEDCFSKKERNVDYLLKTTEFFSSNHLFYKDDGFDEGFSDFSIIGGDYSETGFAPYAVAIHIVHFDNEQNLNITHFVSDSNDDYSDPARKFYEAVEKLVRWNKNAQLTTYGIKEFEKAFMNETYPGLGTVKKWSIMHHLELMNSFLNNEA